MWSVIYPSIRLLSIRLLSLISDLLLKPFPLDQHVFISKLGNNNP